MPALPGKVDPGMEGSGADDGKVTYTGFSTAARDIKDNPKKCGPYADTMLYLGRHGNEKFDMPAAVVDYNPMPYYFTPEDQSEYGDEYPLRLTEGRIPYFHHGTLRNNPTCASCIRLPSCGSPRRTQASTASSTATG